MSFFPEVRCLGQVWAQQNPVVCAATLVVLFLWFVSVGFSSQSSVGRLEGV